MKPLRKTFYTLIFLLGLQFVATAQITFFATDQEAELGDTVTTEIKVKDFSEILSVQFSLNWDSTALRLLSVQDFGLVNLSENQHFFSPNGSALVFAWFDESVLGVALPDSSVLFSVSYKVVTPEDDASIVFSDEPTFIEVGSVSSGILEVTTFPGIVKVDNTTTSTTNLSDHTFIIDQNFPNPFKEATFVSIQFGRPVEATLLVFDTTGKILLQEKGNFPGGNYVWKIDRSDLEAAGIYYYQVRTAEGAVTRKLSFLD